MAYSALCKAERAARHTDVLRFLCLDSYLLHEKETALADSCKSLLTMRPWVLVGSGPS